MARFTAQSQSYLQQIDTEIERLQQLREQVSAAIESEQGLEKKYRQGTRAAKRATKRGMSDAGRLAIAEAQRKRWAAKKAADKKTARGAAGKRRPSKVVAVPKDRGRKAAE